MVVRLLPSLDAKLHYPTHKTSKDIQPLCGLVADHVFKYRKRAETLAKYVMLSATDTMLASIFLSWYRCFLPCYTQ